MADFLLESVLDQVAEGKSPVSGESWPKLSKDYKKKKIEEGAPPIPNMDLHGGMLSALDYKITDDGFRLGFFGDEALKADGHLKFSGKEGTAPKRRSLPAEGQAFKSEIQNEAEAIVQDALAQRVEPSREDFEDVDTSVAFWSALKDLFPERTRPEIAFTIFNTPKLRKFFDSMDLLRFLE